MSEIVIRESGPFANRKLAIEVNGALHGEYALDQPADLVNVAKLFFERDKPKMIRLDVEGDIKPHLAMALIDADVVVPDPWSEDEPYDPKADQAAMLAAAIETHLAAELDELHDEIDGKTVIGITYDEGVMSFVVGDPIEDMAAYFENVTEAVLHATTLVVDHEADGRNVILVVSDLARALQDHAKGQAH